MNRPSDRLPQGWKWAKLGDVCEIVSGSTPKTNVAAYWNGTITWITPTDMGQLPTKYIRSSQRTITQTGYASCSTKLIPAGAVVMSTRAPIGHLGIASVPLCTNQGCKTFVPGADVDTEFLYFSLLIHMEDIQALGSGSTFQEVSKTKLSKFEICLPPFIEQKRIAALLNQQMAYVEKARKAAEEILEAAQALPGAFLRQVFPAHGDVLPAGWKWAALGEIILGKPQYGSAARKVPYNGKVRYVRITDLTDRGELKPDDPVSPSVVQPDRFLEPGDLLIARSGSVGRTYLHGNLPGTYQYAGYLIRFRIDPAKSLPGYVFYVSKSDLWREWIVSNSKTSTLTNINAKQYSSFRLPLPPLPEQKRIAALLKEQMAYVETVRMSAREQLDAINALPASLLRRAFAGTL